MYIQREIADTYQGLFNLMNKEHNLILTISEMDEIIIEVQKVVNKNFVLADVSGECLHPYSSVRRDKITELCTCADCGKEWY